MAYTTEQYLLDKVHINDLILDLYWLADTRQLDAFKDIFAPRVTFDYSAILGLPAKEVTAEEQIQQWSQMLPMLEDSTHTVVPTVAQLPVPDGKVEPPTTCKAGGNTRVYLRRVRNGATIEQDSVGRNWYEFVRTDAPGNPWRLKWMKASSVQRTSGIGDFWKP